AITSVNNATSSAGRKMTSISSTSTGGRAVKEMARKMVKAARTPGPRPCSTVRSRISVDIIHLRSLSADAKKVKVFLEYSPPGREAKTCLWLPKGYAEALSPKREGSGLTRISAAVRVFQAQGRPHDSSIR